MRHVNVSNASCCHLIFDLVWCRVYFKTFDLHVFHRIIFIHVHSFLGPLIAVDVIFYKLTVWLVLVEETQLAMAVVGDQLSLVTFGHTFVESTFFD